MRSRHLYPGQLYRTLGNNHYLFKDPKVGTVFDRLGVVENNALVLYVTKAKDRVYNANNPKKGCMMVKVICGDLVGWIGISHFRPFIPESHFSKVTGDEIPSS